MSNIGLKIFTLLFGNFIGKDEFNNKYYQTSIKKRDFDRQKRWVIYNGDPEPSKVPHQWYSWLHYQTNEIPNGKRKKHSWETNHEPNLTGTKHAYFPQGHIMNTGEKPKSTGDYQSWTPNN